jgi:hypothetical protein
MKFMMMTLLCVTALFADLKIGDGFPVYNLVDQFDNKLAVKQEGNTTLILSFEKDVSTETKKFLDTKKKTFLKDNDIMYISDISSMPSLITSWFALPKMKKFGFPVALIYEDKVADIIPREDEKVTVIKLEYNGIKSIDFVAPKALDTLLK